MKSKKGSGVQSAVIEQIPTAELVPYARNSRTHSDEQVAQIAASIREFGFCNPVLIDAEGTIIAGHGRVMAATRMKLETVPCLRLTHLTDAQRRAYVIADNRIALSSGWDSELLANELSDLHADDFDMGLLGFDPDELTELMGFELPATDAAAEILEDEVPEPPADPITKPGDLWILGSHRLLCGDSTKVDDVGRLMTGSVADMVFTDPPYGVDYDGGHAVKGKRREKLANDATPDIYATTLPVVRQFSKDTAALYLWFSDSKSAAVTAAVTAAGYEVRNTIIWNKNLAQFGAIGAQYKSKHEPCLYCFKKGKAPYWQGPNNEVSVWDVARSSKNEFHPTQKPVGLPARAFGNSCPSEGLVLDLFLGSGTTLIAAEQLNRKCYGMEISPQYCDVIVNRWENLTGKTAVLDGQQALQEASH